MRARRLLLAVAVVLFAVAAQGADIDAVRDAVRDAQAADAVYQNALYLYLRIAGVAWILVEWVAAIILWRGYCLLKKAARAMGFLV